MKTLTSCRCPCRTLAELYKDTLSVTGSRERSRCSRCVRFGSDRDVHPPLYSWKGERAAAAKARLVSFGAALFYETLTVVDALG